MAKQQLGKTDDKPDHPLLTATDHQTEQNTGKAMSKQDKGSWSKHQASVLILNSIFKINSRMVSTP